MLPRQLAVTVLLAMVIGLLSTGFAAAQDDGVRVFYRTTDPEKKSPNEDPYHRIDNPDGWQEVDDDGSRTFVHVDSHGSIYFGCENCYVPSNKKLLSITVETDPRSDRHHLRPKEAMGYDQEGGEKKGKWIYRPGIRSPTGRVKFDPQPEWEYVRFESELDEAHWFTFTTLEVTTKCIDANRRKGRDDPGPGPHPTLELSNAYFGVAGWMVNATRITEIEIFPEHTTVDGDTPPTFSADPGSGNWSYEFVDADPDGISRPQGGVRWASDGHGLEAQEAYEMTLAMTAESDTLYSIYAYDADADAYQTFMLDLGGLPWWERFDIYDNGSAMHGVREWKGWDNDSAFDALVTDAQARSAPHSVDIKEAADIVHEFSGADSGKWAFTAWQYIPADFQSDNGGPFDPGTYFLLLNTYNDGGPYDWSVQYIFDSNDGMLKVNHGEGQNTIDVPYLTDQWVKIEAVIDLDNDLTQVYYDDALLAEYSWTGGIYGEGDGVGALDIAAVDLFANGSTSVYYDDLALVRIDQPGSMVWDNMPNGPAGEHMSSQLDVAFPFDSQVADDFTPASTCDIIRVEWNGGFWGGGPITVPLWHIIFYADAAGRPTGGPEDPTDTALEDFTVTDLDVSVVTEDDGSFTYSVELPGAGFRADAGTTYWIAIQAEHPYPPQWGIAIALDSLQGGEAMVGFPLLGWEYWTPGSVVFGNPRDMAFRLYGADDYACPGDLDGDGTTGHSDLGILLSDWGCDTGDCVGDLDGNGTTGHSDLGILLSDWGCGTEP